MANLAYNRSTRRERALVNKLRAEGWDACRSAGSKSPWDVWAIKPKDGLCCVYQIKTKKGGRTETIKLLTRNGGVSSYWVTYE